MAARIFLTIALIVCLASFSNAFYEKSSAVTTLTAQNFAQNVVASSKVWVVEFYAPWCGHCKSFTPEYVKAAENLKGIVHLGAVDCDNKENQPICGHFKIQGFPTVKLFKADPEPTQVEGKQALTKEPVDYQGQRTAGPLANWALSFLPDKVGTLTDARLADFENLPFTKALLFSEKDSHSNMLKALACDFDERTALMQENRKYLSIAQVSSSQKQTVEKYKITKFPTLVVISATKEVTVYEGEMKYEPLYTFLKANANEMTEQRRREVFEAGKKAGERTPSPPPPPPPPAVPPQLWHVTDQKSYDEACRASGICLIAFLDPSSAEHATYLSALEKLVATPKFGSVRILWVDGVANEAFKNAFQTADGYPQAVAFQRKSKRIRYFKSGFEEGLLTEFLEMVLGGKGRTASLDQEPAFTAAKTEL